MPAPTSSLRKDLFKLVLLPAGTLLILPALGLAFCAYGTHKLDQEIQGAVNQQIDREKQIPADQKPAVKDFYARNPASEVCGSSDPRLAKYREAVCATFADVWQFRTARQVSTVALVFGLLGILGSALLGLLAYGAPKLQYVAFRSGWLTLTWLTAAEVILQGALAVWLSFWVTALFFNLYAVKLILVAAFVALAGIWTALRGLFRRIPFGAQVEGEVVPRDTSAPLWDRLAQLASKVGTPPPTHIVAGIDDNFFVTEAPLVASGREISGRSLFVSLPLLRLLSGEEADAVLAHELAHFRGGDTAASTRLGPTLVRYDAYLHTLSTSLMTLPALYVMRMFRVIFELARTREQRRRELLADRAAAEVTSPDALGRSLLKTTAYSSHRAATETALFDQNQRHTEGALSIKDRVAQGLADHVLTARFKDSIANANVPHPFDTHPALEERLKNVGAKVAPADCETLLHAERSGSWTELLADADRIENQLWAGYEARFTKAHEQSLAYRYLPSNDEERALVERFFPAQTFENKDGTTLRLTYAALVLADGTTLPLRDIAKAKVDDGNFSTKLVLTHVAGSSAGAGPTKVNLRALGNAAAQQRFKQAFGSYWQRDQVARQVNASAPAQALAS